MNTVQLECFLAVGRNLNFSKAAKEVKLTQPAVSHQIRSLEEELGVKLFRRTSKNVSMTPEGRRFFPDADRIIKIAASARERLHSDTEPIPLEIGCDNQAELTLLSRPIKELKKEYPQLHPFVRQVPFDILHTLLEAEQIDIMFGMKGMYKNAAFQYRELFSCPICCVCSENHPLAQHRSLTTDLLRGAMILCESHRIPPSLFQFQIQIASSFPEEQRFFGDGYESVLTLVRAELGYTLLPALPGSAEPGLHYIPLTDQGTLSFGLYHSRSGRSPLLKRFWQLMKEYCETEIQTPHR